MSLKGIFESAVAGIAACVFGLAAYAGVSWAFASYGPVGLVAGSVVSLVGASSLGAFLGRNIKDWNSVGVLAPVVLFAILAHNTPMLEELRTKPAAISLPAHP